MSDTEDYECELTAHYNPYTTLYVEECDLNQEMMRSCYDDMGDKHNMSPTYETKIISPTSSHSSLHDDVSPVPFWYDNEDEQHIQHIMIWYTHQLQLRMAYERIHGERSPLIFIGSIRRHVIRSQPGTWRTLDIISTYTRDHVPLGFTMTPLQCDIAYRTTWDMSDGMPIAIKKLSHVDHQHYLRHLDMTHPPSYLHAIPIFACDDFAYTCNHMSREIGYAGAQAHAIHVTAQLTGMPHQQTQLLRSTSDEKKSCDDEDEDAKHDADDWDGLTHEYIPDDEEEERYDDNQHDSDVTDSEEEEEEETRSSSSDDDLTTYRQAVIKDTFPSYKQSHHTPPHCHSYSSSKHSHQKPSRTSKSLHLSQDDEFLTACGTYEEEEEEEEEDVDENEVAALAASLGLGIVRKSPTPCTGGWESHRPHRRAS